MASFLLSFVTFLSTTTLTTADDCDLAANLGVLGIEVFSPGDTGYDDAAFQWGSNFVDFVDTIAPGVIAFATSGDDVVDIINFVNNCDQLDTITIRSGGHQYNGLSSCDSDSCLQIDLTGLDTFEVMDADYTNPNDPLGAEGQAYSSALVQFGPGWSFFDLYPVAGANGLVLLGGICGDVHTGGNYQSSAHSIFTHSLGSGMDYIVSFDIVLADGSLITVTEDNNYANLFWAIRGGSPAAFGVIISYDVQLYYGSNFPNAGLAYTIYRFGVGDEQTDENIAVTLGEIYNEISGHPTFTDSVDIGSIYAFSSPAPEDASSSLSQLLNFVGADHYFLFLMTYLGRESNAPMLTSAAYTDLVTGILRNSSVVVEDPILVNDVVGVPSQFLPNIAALVVFDRPAGYAQLMGSSLFSDGVYQELGKGLASLVNANPPYKAIAVFQGATYGGGQFLAYDPDQTKTAHPYRDTQSYIDLTLRFANETRPITDPGAPMLQQLIDDLFDDLRDLISEDDRDKRWIPYTYGDSDINNVWPNYYNNDIGVYNELRCTKYIVDPDDLFNTLFTVDPRECDSGAPTEEPTEEPEF